MINRLLSGGGSLSLVLLLSSCGVGSDNESQPPPTTPPGGASAVAVNGSATASKAPRDWRRAMSKLHPAKDGCFESTYPSTSWVEVPCGKPPSEPLRPGAGLAGTGATAETVGGGTGDWVAKPPKGTISWAEGSFPLVSGVTSESANGLSNAFSLQLNTNYFQTPACQGAGCQGWQQFVYNSDGSQAYIQYWLLSYGGKNGTTCPAGFMPGPPDPLFGHDCFRNSTGSALMPPETIGILDDIAVTGAAGSSDMLSVAIGPKVYILSQASILGLNGGKWTAAEFNVFGDSGGDEAIFNPGSTITVQTLTDTPTSASTPTCGSGSFTGETNNLSLLGFSCCGMTPNPVPGIQFTETNVANAPVPVCPLVPTNPNWSAVDHPFDEIITGKDVDGTPLMSCRSRFEGTQVGKTRDDWSYCDISYGGGENQIPAHETLVAAWTDETNGNVPGNALPIGSDGLNGPALYSCRAYLNGNGYQLGKVRPGFAGCDIPYGGSEQTAPDYQVLTSSLPLSAEAVNAASPPSGALVGGYDSDGAPLYVCEAVIASGLAPGKTKSTWTSCDVSWGGTENFISNYYVLIPRFETSGTEFVAGTDSNGTNLGICQASYEGSEQVGKLLSNGACNVPFGGQEISFGSGFLELGN